MITISYPMESSLLKQRNLEDCIFRMASGDEKALEELYRQTDSTVYSYALSVLKNTFDAEDIMHDCYLHIFYSAGQYRQMGKPLAWIFTITRNLCMQKLRERSRISEQPEENWDTVILENPDISVENRLLIEKCMRLLTDEERQIVILHAVTGFKHREIAELLGLLLPTVLSKYSRAIKKLKKALEEEGEKG